MKLTLHIDKINYESLIDQTIPLLKEKAKQDNGILMKTVSGILSMPGDIPKKMLKALPQETQDELVLYLLNTNKENIIEWLQSALTNKGFDIELADIEAEK